MADNTTVRDQIQRTKVHLYGAQRLELRQLDADLSADGDDDRIDLDSYDGIVRGSLLGFGEELWYVLEVDTATPVRARVVRGFQRSILTEHTAGELGELNPRFPAPSILGALADEVASWGEELYRVRTAVVGLRSGSTAVVLPAWTQGCYGLVDATWCVPGVWEEDWRPLPRASYSRIQRDSDCDAPVIKMGQIPAVDVSVKVTLALPFCTDEWKPTTDMLADVGLQRSMLDLAPLGAALRLWSTQEIPISDRIGQPQPRRATEVPPGTVSQVLGPLASLIRQRKKEESGKLMARFPIRIQ